ncbi:MAG: hypothetical protein QM680_13160 [Luteolibacter sp.]
MASITREELEWLRSPEAIGKGVSAAEIIAYEELLYRREKLELHIKTAFSGCRLGDGIGLLEADAWDMCVDPEKPKQAREKDEREDWQKLSRDDLYWCNSALSFTDSLGYRFLLPAFMLADLDGDIDELIIIHLSLTKEDRLGKRSLLNSDQIRTIIEFLMLILDDSDSISHHEAIAESLNVFWNPLLQQRTENTEQADAGNRATRGA